MTQGTKWIRHVVRWLAGMAALVSVAVFACGLRAAPHDSAAGTSDETAAKPLRIVVDRFDGDSHNIVRAGVTMALEREHSVDLVSIRALEKARPLLDGSPQGYEAAARKLDVGFIIRGKLRHADSQYHLTLMVYGADGKTRAWLPFSADKLGDLRTELRKHFWERLEPVLAGQAEAPPTVELEEQPEASPTPKPTEKPEERPTATTPLPPPPPPPSPESPRAEAAPASATNVRCPWLLIGAAGGTLMREFNYTGERRGALRGDRSTRLGSPVFEGSLGLFPFSRNRCGAASGFGISGTVERSVGIKSRLAMRSLTTTASAERAELEYRLDPGVFWLHLHAGYWGRRFGIEGDDIPDVQYLAAGGGLDLGIRAGWFVLGVGGTALDVLDGGQITSARWFPRAKIIAVDAHAELGVSPASFMDVVLVGRWAGYFLTLHADPGTGAYPNGVADTAYDHYLVGELALRFFVPGRRRAP